MKISRGAALDRYYLLKLFGFGIFLHRIHHSDPGAVYLVPRSGDVALYHSHPWSGLSLILGSYVEIRYGENPKRRWLWNWINAKVHHRVLIAKPVWTLFIHLPKSNRWSVINENGCVLSEEPWKGDKGFKDYSASTNLSHSQEGNHACNHVPSQK
jgi:hypothetical protein